MDTSASSQGRLPVLTIESGPGRQRNRGEECGRVTDRDSSAADHPEATTGKRNRLWKVSRRHEQAERRYLLIGVGVAELGRDLADERGAVIPFGERRDAREVDCHFRAPVLLQRLNCPA